MHPYHPIPVSEHQPQNVEHPVSIRVHRSPECGQPRDICQNLLLFQGPPKCQFLHDVLPES